MRSGQDCSGRPATPDEALRAISLPSCAVTAQKLLLAILFISAMLAAPTVTAQECETNTVARRLGVDKARINFETLDEKNGRYVATLKNGDLVMASFTQCGLGMHAHFYSRAPITHALRIQTLRWFVSAVLPGQAAYAYIEKQIGPAMTSPTTSPAIYSDKTDYTFTGTNGESHTFEFKTSESPLFSTALHYRWTPPSH